MAIENHCMDPEVKDKACDCTITVDGSSKTVHIEGDETGIFMAVCAAANALIKEADVPMEDIFRMIAKGVNEGAFTDGNDRQN